MRLLGWGRDTIYPRNIQISEGGVLELTSKNVYAADFSLREFVSEMYREAQHAYLQAVPMGASADEANDILEKHLPALDRADRMVKDAKRYMVDIVDALAQGHESGLRLDAERTTKTGDQHITIKSLDEWSDTRYRPQPADGAVVPDEDDPSIGRLNKPLNEMPKTERGLYTVLGLIAETYANDMGKGYFDDGKINNEAIAEAISDYANANYMDGDGNFPDQSQSTIRARLMLAKKCLDFQKKALVAGNRRK